MQCNVHKTGRARVGPYVVCLCLHIKRGKFNAHFIFAQFLIILHLRKKGRCRLIQQTDAIMSSIFDWEVRRLGMRDVLKHGTIMVSEFGYFHIRSLPLVVSLLKNFDYLSNGCGIITYK